MFRAMVVEQLQGLMAQIDKPISTETEPTN
jgi:hypothetical protein